MIRDQLFCWYNLWRINITKKSVFFTGPRLIEYEEYLLAAKVFVCADMMKEAIDAFIAGDYWSKARQLSSELDSS